MMGRLSRGVLVFGAAVAALGGMTPALAQGTPTKAEEVLILVNQRRAEAGLRPLRLQAQLQQSAQDYAEDMAQYNYFSHTGRDGSTPFSRMAAAGYRGTMMGENIARGFTSAVSVMDAWMNSSGHRANILNAGYTEIGIGIAQGSSGTYWVQNFGASSFSDDPAPPAPLPPAITGLSPHQARIGDPVTITGQRFGVTKGTVVFGGGKTGETSSWTDTRIVATVPHGALSGSVYVQNKAGTSAGAYLSILGPAADAPTLESAQPPQGAPGTLVTLYGRNLGATQGKVTFNGVAAVVMNWAASGLYVQVLVPQGAGNGPVVVTRAGDGKATNGLNFIVNAPPAQPSTPSQPVPINPTPTNPTPTNPTPTNPPGNVTQPTRPTWPNFPIYRWRYYRYRPWQ